MYKIIIALVGLTLSSSFAVSLTPQQIQQQSKDIEDKALAEKRARDQEEAQKIELQRQRQWTEEHPGVPYPRQPTPGNSSVILPRSSDPIINRSREIESRALTEKCQREQADFQTRELQRERQWVEEKPGIPYPRQAAPACGNTQNNSANNLQPAPNQAQLQPANTTPQDSITQRSREIEARALFEKCLREQADQRTLELQRERQWIEEKPGIPYPRKPLMTCEENKYGNERALDRPTYSKDNEIRQPAVNDEYILRQLREAREKLDEVERAIRARTQNSIAPQSTNNKPQSPQDEILRRSREIQSEAERGKANEFQTQRRSNDLAQFRQTVDLSPQSPYINKTAEVDPLTGNPKKKPNFTCDDLKRDFQNSCLAMMPAIDTRY
jgi:hypothetical protein